MIKLEIYPCYLVIESIFLNPKNNRNLFIKIKAIMIYIYYASKIFYCLILYFKCRFFIYLKGLQANSLHFILANINDP